MREVCSCPCLPVLPGPAWVLLSKICIPFCRSLYIHSLDWQRWHIGGTNFCHIYAFDWKMAPSILCVDAMRSKPVDRASSILQSSGKKACTSFGLICFCSCLPLLPGPAWVLHSCLVKSTSLQSPESPRNFLRAATFDPQMKMKMMLSSVQFQFSSPFISFP